MVPPVKLNNPLMGTEILPWPKAIELACFTIVKLNNPLMGTEI